MKEKKQVVIYDDDEGLRREWGDRLLEVPGFKERFIVLFVSTEDFRRDIEALRKRRSDSRIGDGASNSGTFFDETAILIIDYDLFEDKETGEEVAYLARCYSECGTIIAVNQFAKNGFIFDLTLKGQQESFADLNLLDEQIFEPGLWSFPWNDFRPWYWPHLPKAVEDFERRVDEVEESLDQSILTFLRIPPEIRQIFPLKALEFISSKEDVDGVTFRGFVERSGSALRAKDEAGSDRARARIAAARLFKCLERLVLPGQNIVVDASHLLERYPSLFKGGSPEQLIGWHQTFELMRPNQSVMDVAKIDRAAFQKDAWLSRTAWYWPLVSEYEEILEVADPWVSRPKLAFCEDTSRFVDVDEAVEFVAEVDSPFVRRFVSTRHPRYGPKQQFAL